MANFIQHRLRNQQRCRERGGRDQVELVEHDVRVDDDPMCVGVRWERWEIRGGAEVVLSQD